jgi:hypothetical protein
VSPIHVSALKAGMRIDTSGFIQFGPPSEVITGAWIWQPHIRK